jgi:YVTN family beta-propeller protein
VVGTANGVNIVMNSPLEVCNNFDDNCNGIIDESLIRSCYSGPGGTANVGQCLAGTQTCSAGSWGVCAGQVTPGSEACDGIDNDCDGSVDESTSGSAPVVSNFSATAATICQGVGTTVTVTSTSLLRGRYTVTYNISGTNTVSSTTATLTVASNGAGGTFTTAALTNSGANTVNITAIVFTSSNCNSSSALSVSANFTVNATVAASVSISANPGNVICAAAACTGTNVTFTATLTNGGVSPVYQWKLNGMEVGTNSATYSNDGLNNGNIITCVMTSNATCPTGNPATSNAITMTVNPLPTVNSVPSQVLCAGSSTTAITFSGSVIGTTYNWTNTETSIGLAANGTGDITSFVATNSGTTAKTALITVTPEYTSGGITCYGTSSFISIKVNPTPNVNTSISNQTLCAGATTSLVDFTGTVGGIKYNWVNNNTSIGLAASGSGNIAAFTATNTGTTPITATITATPVSSGCVYMLDSYADNLSVIDRATNTVDTILTLGYDPDAIAISPDESRVYTEYDASAISVINTTTNSIITNIALSASAYSIVISPDGSRIYATNYWANSVSVINSATNTVIATIPVGTEPTFMCLQPDGSRLYVSNMASDNLSVINTATNTVIATIAIGDSPRRMCIKQDGSRLYVANAFSDEVSVINTTTNSLIANIPVGNDPRFISINPDGNKVYVANSSGASVSVINTVSNSVIATIPVGVLPLGVLQSIDGTNVYVPNNDDNTVSVINTTNNTVSTTIAVGSWPKGIATSPDGSRVYVGNSLSNNVSVINTATNTVVATVATGDADSETGFVTGTNCSGNAISFTITVNPVVTPSVSIAANPTGSLCENTDVTFTATPTNQGGTPSYNWKVNGFSAQTGASTTFTTSSLNDNDAITCELTSNATCASPTLATSNSITVDVIPCPNTWLGTTTTWTSNSNWSSGTAPTTCSDDVVIAATANNPIISSNANVGDLIINSGAGVTLNATLNVCGNISAANNSILGSGTLNFNGSGNQTLTGTLSVTGIVNVSTGATLVTNGGLILENGASLMHGSGTSGAGGSVTGTITVKRQGTSSANNYNYWSSSVVNGNVPGSSAYSYNPGTGTNGYADDNNPNPDPGWAAHSGAMLNGKGYASKGAGLASFIGIPNNNTISNGITTSSELLTSVTPPSKFNLIGNPYPSSISASQLYFNNSSLIAFAFYFWNDDGSGGSGYASNDYAKYTNLGGTAASSGGATPNGNIASCQGFVAEAIADGDLQFTNSLRGTSNTTFFKTQEDVSRIWLNLKNDSLYSELLIGFAADATDQRDLIYDAYNLRGNSALAFAAVQENDDFGIVAFSPVNDEKIIPLTAYVANEGIYTISNKADENFENINIYLEDRLNGSFTPLNNNGIYSCLMNSENTSGRFYLHFSTTVTGLNTNSTAAISAYQSHSELIVLLHNLLIESGAFLITDMAGRVLQITENINLKSGVYKTDVSKLSAGVYLVTLQTQNGNYSKKIVIR